MATPSTRRRRLVAIARWALSLLALGLVVAFIDTGAITAQLHDVAMPWVVAALALTIPQTASMAWRWHFTARAVDAPLPFTVAWREYYVAVLLNQVLPGGVLGDVARVVRGTSPARPLDRIASSVVLERASGQLVLWVVLLATIPILGASPRARSLATGLGIVVAIVAIVAIVAAHPRLHATALGRFVARARSDIGRAFGSPRALVFQLVTSLLALSLLVAQFVCCARAVASGLSIADACLLVPWVLAATALPLTVGGWGVREATTAAVFDVVALPAGQGVAASLLFGAVALIGALPGLPALVRRLRTPEPEPSP